MSTLVMNLEMNAILKDFVNRQRVHKDIPINLNRFFQRLTLRGLTLDRALYDDAFLQLEFEGHGHIKLGQRGALISFRPKNTLVDLAKSLGFTPDTIVPIARRRHRVLRPVQQAPNPVRTVINNKAPENSNRVTVLFSLQGLRCSAEVPREALQEFESKIKI